MDQLNKINFLTSLENKTFSIAKVVKDYNLWKGRSYDTIAQINAHNSASSLSIEHLLKIYKVIYDYYYKYITAADLTTYLPQKEQAFRQLLSMEKYQSQNMSGEDCLNFVHHDQETVFEKAGISPMLTQEDNQIPISQGNIVSQDYIHCAPFGIPQNQSCRLYINIKPKNIYSLIQKLLEKCHSKQLTVYFKFWTNDIRNDPFIIYTNYNQINMTVRLFS